MKQRFLLFIAAFFSLFLVYFFVSQKPAEANFFCSDSGESCAAAIGDGSLSFICTDHSGWTNDPNGGASWCSLAANGDCCKRTGGGGGPTYTCTDNGGECWNNTRPYGWQYNGNLTCPPQFDGCITQCLDAQTCDRSTAGGQIPNGNCGWITCKQQCNQQTCTQTACGGYPANSCYNGNGTYTQTCMDTLYNGSSNCEDYPPAPIQRSIIDCTVNNCSNNYACNGGNCTTSIFVHVYIDYGHDGGNDANYPYGVVKINGGNAQTTGSDGSVTYNGLTTGAYTISYSDNSPDFQATGATSQNVNLTNNNGNVTVNFRVTPLYSISGNVFDDINKNLNDDGSDTPYTNSSTIHFAGGPTAVSDINTSNGTYATPETLESGTYTVSQTHTLADGYSYTTPSTWQVTVGNPTGNPKCSVSTSPDAVCGNPSNGSISGLNFGLTNENPWSQSVCLDVRDDSGTYQDLIPAAPSCGGVSGAYNSITNGSCSTGAGVVFTCDATGDFGLGQPNINNWTAGGIGANEECYKGPGLDVIRVSYEYLQTTARESDITPTDMNQISVCGAGGINNCTLSDSLPKGVYQTNGNLNLNAYTFPAPPDPTIESYGYIFMINGNLTINGNILIPRGSVAVFSTSGSITVDKSVGQVVTDTSDPTVNDPNLEGIYSADTNFVINSYGSLNNYCNGDGTPKDKKLNILGSVITNASKTGGVMINNRDLCKYDLECPPVSTGDGSGVGGNGDGGTGGADGSGSTGEGTVMSYWLALLQDGQFINHKLFNWSELRP